MIETNSLGKKISNPVILVRDGEEGIVDKTRTFRPVGYSNEIIHCYVATDLRQVGANLDDDEFLEVLYVPFEEALEMVADGRITDVKSVVSLTLARSELR